MLYAGHTEHEVRYDCVERILKALKKVYVEFYNYVHWALPAWERDGFYDCDHCYEDFLIGKMTGYLNALRLVGYCRGYDITRCRCTTQGRTRKHAWKRFLRENIYIEP